MKETERRAALPDLRAVGTGLAGRVTVMRVVVEEYLLGFFHLLEDKALRIYLLLEGNMESLPTMV